MNGRDEKGKLKTKMMEKKNDYVTKGVTKKKHTGREQNFHPLPAYMLYIHLLHARAHS